jgi:hypothetical protein
LGLAFLLWLGYGIRGASTAVIAVMIAIALALLAFYVGVHRVLTRYGNTIPSGLGLLIAVGPPALVFFLGLPGGLIFGKGEGMGAVLLYIGVSLVAMAWRADPGCEVLTLPNGIFRNYVQLPCILFTPIDTLERKLRGQK